MARIIVGGPHAASTVGGSPTCGPTASGQKFAGVPGHEVGHIATVWPQPKTAPSVVPLAEAQ